LYLQDYSIILNGKKQEKNDTKINYFKQLINFTFYEAIKIDVLVKSQKYPLTLEGRGLG